MEIVYWVGAVVIVAFIFFTICLVKEGRSVLEQVQDSMSETECSERTGARRKVPNYKEKGPPERGEKRTGGERREGRLLVPPEGPVYPRQDLSRLMLSDRESVVFEDAVTESGRLRPLVEPLDPEDESDLEEEAARYEAEQYYSDEFPPNNALSQGDRLATSRPSAIHDKGRAPGPCSSRAAVPTAPPPEFLLSPPYEGTRRPSTSLFSTELRRQMRAAFPVFEGEGGGQRVHAQVEFSQIKELAEASRKYGVTANYTLSLLDRLARDPMTPRDWQDVAKATLPSQGKFLEWKALWYDAAQDQARANQRAQAREQQAWTFEMLTGQGPHSGDQTNFPWGVYAQVSSTAIRAWKGLMAKGDAGNQLTKIVQGPQELFSDFVARMTEAASRIFGDVETAAPLIEQLIFEQATQECRTAIAPRKSKGLQDWLRTCREIGGPLTNAGLAAAMLRSQQREKERPNARTCFNCGRPGHLKRDCRSPAKASPELCRRCGKGYHKAEHCRSVRDIKGKLLPPIGEQDSMQQESKNGNPGPWSQGPKKYGTRFMRERQDPHQDSGKQDWTSVQPPESY